MQQLLAEKEEVMVIANEIEIRTLIRCGICKKYRKLNMELDPFDEGNKKVKIR